MKLGKRVCVCVHGLARQASHPLGVCWEGFPGNCSSWPLWPFAWTNKCGGLQHRAMPRIVSQIWFWQAWPSTCSLFFVIGWKLVSEHISFHLKNFRVLQSSISAEWSVKENPPSILHLCPTVSGTMWHWPTAQGGGVCEQPGWCGERWRVYHRPEAGVTAEVWYGSMCTKLVHLPLEPTGNPEVFVCFPCVTIWSFPKYRDVEALHTCEQERFSKRAHS